MKNYQKIYDQSSIHQGFTLLEKNCNEKQFISTQLQKLISAILQKTPLLSVLDMGGGSAQVWRLFPKPLLQKFNLTLVDSSSRQIKKAKKLKTSTSAFKPVCANVITFLKNSGQSFDLIVANHFFPGLSSQDKDRAFSAAISHLSPAGRLFIVQPHPQSPLTALKKELKGKLLKKSYSPRYLNCKALAPALKVSSQRANHTLVIPRHQLHFLAHFLLGQEASRFSASSLSSAVQESLFIRPASDQNCDEFHIDIYNSLHILQKP